MDNLKREMWLNEMVERAATLTYYLLFALGPVLALAVWLA